MRTHHVFSRACKHAKWKKIYIVVLSWFVESDIIDKAMDGELIEEESIEC